jgi:hypothetical protein
VAEVRFAVAYWRKSSGLVGWELHQSQGPGFPPKSVGTGFVTTRGGDDVRARVGAIASVSADAVALVEVSHG